MPRPAKTSYVKGSNYSLHSTACWPNFASVVQCFCKDVHRPGSKTTKRICYERSAGDLGGSESTSPNRDANATRQFPRCSERPQFPFRGTGLCPTLDSAMPRHTLWENTIIGRSSCRIIPHRLARPETARHKSTTNRCRALEYPGPSVPQFVRKAVYSATAALSTLCPNRRR
jgi:hypothetical protein